MVGNNNAVEAEGRNDQAQQQRPEGRQANLWDNITQIILIICALQFASSLVHVAIKGFGKEPEQHQQSQQNVFNLGANITQVAKNGGIVIDPPDDRQTKRRPVGATGQHSKQSSIVRKSSGKHSSVWSQGTSMHLNIFVTQSATPSKSLYSYTLSGGSGGGGIFSMKDKAILASWHEENLLLSSTGASNINNRRNRTITFPITTKMLSNDTQVYAHLFLSRKHSPENDKRMSRSPVAKSGELAVNVLQKTIPLTRYRVRRKAKKEKSLLGGDSHSGKNIKGGNKFDHDDESSNDTTVLGMAAQNFDKDITLMYFKPTLSLQLVTDLPPFFRRGTIPSQLSKLMDFYNASSTSLADPSLQTTSPSMEFYYPILHSSEFWITSKSLIPINGTLQSVSIECSIENIKMWKWQLMSQMEENWRAQERRSGEDGESDLVRTILMDTNPWLLAVTAIVSLMHTLFDCLAFKNDISFFKGKKSMEGLSLRSMLINTFFQSIILLYLIDNETSFMVIVSNGVGLVIEIWKISKAVSVSYKDGQFTWTEVASYAKSRTKEYDETATSHLLYATMPLVTGYGIYSLNYQKHKGWYSWILNTLVGFIYMFGFVMMTPQLFINYKLQSVAHLNWRTMSYKCMNTFVDDLFSFVIKMPIMHRLACLRDDMIFFVFLYQRWKYRTDYSRVNEYGQCAQPTEEMISAAQLSNAGEADTAGSTMLPKSRSVPSASNGNTNNGVRQRRGAREKKH